MSVTPERASLAGRVAVVTGAANGIGKAIAVALAAFGADLAVCDRDEQGLASTVATIESFGRQAATGILDVRDGPAVATFVSEVVATFGRIDVLVNNAGGGFHAPFANINEKGQRALVDENFTSVTNFVRASTPHLADGSSIINVTSVEAFRAAPGFSIYAAMKAAVEQLTRTLALELSDRRIRVNCIAPDAIPTPGDEGLADSVHGGSQEGYATAVPLGLGTVDDCAGAAVFLAGDLSGFVTGSTLHVDGGSNAARGWRRRSDGGWLP
ncbi:MAG TPA: SDR family NAD(P)-dependent oxidoreductase [Acidimicrobiales bacterium]|jgi:3-oxoacyl-[acyl-carrier protein] reductase|nr:SDR family NAD(P)-dependent oxidoreductase [Acidimicrobiales bacterium]